MAKLDPFGLDEFSLLEGMTTMVTMATAMTTMTTTMMTTTTLMAMTMTIGRKRWRY